MASNNADGDTGDTSAISSDDDIASARLGKTRMQPQGGSSRFSQTFGDRSDVSEEEDDQVPDDDPVARLRAKMGSSTSSGRPSASNESSLLSSAPPLDSPQSQPKAAKAAGGFSSGSEADSEELSGISVRRGAVAGRMKRRGAAQAVQSADTNEATSGSSSRSQSPPSSSSTLENARRGRASAAERKTKLAAMAARKQAAEPSLEDEFFGQVNRSDHNSTGDDPIRSSSNADDDDEDGNDSDDLPDATKLAQQAPKRKPRSQASKPAKPKGPKPLSKKELEEMHKFSARIERSKNVPSLNMQSQPVNRLQYDIGSLAARFSVPEPVASSSDMEGHDDMHSSDPIESETPKATSSSDIRAPLGKISPTHLRSQGSTSNLGSHPSEADKESQRRKEALRLKKEKWLLSMQHEAQRPDITVRAREGDELDDIEVVSSDRPGLSRSLNDKVASSSGTVAIRLFRDELDKQNKQSGPVEESKPTRRRSGPPASRQLDLKQALLQKIKEQNIKARAAREPPASRQVPQVLALATSSSTEVDGDDSFDALKSIQDRVRRQGPSAEFDSEEDKDDDNSDVDFVPAEDRDALGSGSEVGSADEDEDEGEFSLDQAPPSSQNTHRSNASIPRSSPDISDGDQDDEADQTLKASRKSRARQTIMDDEDADDEIRDDPDQLANSGLSRDSIDSTDKTFMSYATVEGIESTSSRSGAPAGLTQFFADTQMSNAPQIEPESQQMLVEDQTAPQPAMPSDDSVLGQFFAETQMSAPARGESLDVIGATGRAKNADLAPFITESAGLSQFFDEGTQDPNAGPPAPATQSAPIHSALMPPPAAIPQDGFAALRRAAQAEENLVASPNSLPSIEDFGGEEDAEPILPASDVSHAAAQRTPKQYLNAQGFFTQTRPDVESQWNSTQSASQDTFAHRRDSYASEDGEPSQRDSASQVVDDSAKGHAVTNGASSRKKRFRRHLSAADEDNSDVEAPSQDEEGQSSGEEDGNDTDIGDAVDDARGSGSEPEDAEAPRNAWQALREGASRANQAKPEKGKKRRREYQFVEGEAEESDEDDGSKKHKRGAGGLGGIWSDSGSDKGDSGDEDSGDSDDDRDLEELVNNEREVDEDTKDLLARERYQQDLDADEAAALALADKAARGELRNRRRRRDGEGRLEDLLDDDFDEERLMRKINNPRALMAKRRKVEGDQMDLLAARPESQAFVKGYSETHQTDSGDQYGFLAAVDESEEDSDRGTSDREDEDAAARGSDGEEDVDVAARRITRKQLAKELRDRKARRNQGIVSDDEDFDTAKLAPAQPPRDPFGSDESGDENAPAFLRDRLVAKQKLPSASTGAAKRSHFAASASGDNATTEDNDGDDDDDMNGDDPSTTLIQRLSRHKRAVSPRTARRLAQIADEFKSEPDFLAGRQHAHASKGLGGSSITSFGASSKGKDRQKAGAGAFETSRLKANGQSHKKNSTLVEGSGILTARRVEESQ
ncbi:unnamed protein product [Sympodiomycopsis kandeliae]